MMIRWCGMSWNKTIQGGLTFWMYRFQIKSLHWYLCSALFFVLLETLIMLMFFVLRLFWHPLIIKIHNFRYSVAEIFSLKYSFKMKQKRCKLSCALWLCLFFLTNEKKNSTSVYILECSYTSNILYFF